MSLRLRLSLGITAVLVLFFSLVGLVEQKLLRDSYIREVDNLLLVRAGGLEAELAKRAAASPKGLEPESLKNLRSAVLSYPSSSQDVYVQVSRPDGSLLYVSEELSGGRLPSDNPRLEHMFETVAAGGTELRVLRVPIITPTDSRHVATLVVADSLELVDAAVLHATRLLIATRAVELALTLVVALALLSKGLAPLRRVAETAERIIEAGDVSQRVDVVPGDDEVSRIANSFNEVVSKVESLLLAQRRLLADTSHELRNPLTVVRNNVDFLAKDLDAETRREVADETEKEIRRMISLVEDLMLLSKTENTRPVRMEPVRLDRLAREAVERLQPTTNGRTLQLGDSNATPVVLGDEDRLRQILTNLISNAIRYTDADGRIVVRVERRKDMGVVVVADNGIGISEEHLPHVFERFYRVDTARARATGGSGLGLAIVKALVDAHGGRVEVQSALGKGTTFTVFIPLEEAEKPRITNLMPVVRE